MSASLGTPGGDNSCAGLDVESREALVAAAETLVSARGFIISLVEWVGDWVGRAGGSATQAIKDTLGVKIGPRASEIVEAALRQALTAATVGMDADGEGDRWGWFHKLVATANGVGAGFVGAPGLLYDLPVTTGVILRSVADIARSFPDERLDSEQTRRAIIEVFALGGPEDSDDDADQGYWATKMALNNVAIEQVVRLAASRFGVVISEKLLAQAVPIIGAAAGGFLNYAFIDYYQQMARVHFTIRQVERRAADPSAVRACFDAHVRIIRGRVGHTKTSAVHHDA